MADGIFDHIHNDKNGEAYEVADSFARAAIENLNALQISFVEELPTEDIDTRTIYFVPSQTATQENTYDEYINTDGTSSGWEIIGSTAVDLSQYYTKAETDDLLAEKVDAETGKGLSSEDYTTAEKEKLATIQTGAEENIQSDWQQANTTADDYIKNKPSLAPVATSGDYSDLSGAPTLATVATSGSYNDLSDKPTIAGQVNSDWNATSGVEEILNKPNLAQIATSGQADDVDYDNTSSGLTASNAQDAIDELSQEKADTISLAAVATSGNYSDLSNTPTIPDISGKMDKSGPTGTGALSINRRANTTVGYLSTAVGFNSTASGAISTAEGGFTTASGDYSHAEGYGSQASGDYSHAEGENTSATGDFSHAEGNQTRAWSDCQHVSGKYNRADSSGTYAEIIGNGSDDNNRSNARTLDWNGNETISGDLHFNGGAQSLSQQLADKADASSLATVATSGDYTDLSNTPTIPAAQVNSDWNSSSGVSEILNKPTFKTINSASILGSGNITTPDTKPSGLTNVVPSSAAAVPTGGTWTKLEKINLPAGHLCLVTVHAQYENNTTGYRSVGIGGEGGTATIPLGAHYQLTLPPPNGAASNLVLTVFFTPEANVDYYIVTRHTMGSTKNCTYRYRYVSLN